jgi:hypothetical protein
MKHIRTKEIRIKLESITESVDLVIDQDEYIQVFISFQFFYSAYPA